MKTWLELREEIENDHDLQEETMITASDLLSWANEAIDDAEEMVHTETEGKYFETETTISIVNGQSTYDLPANMYANKIVNLFYNKGDDSYEVHEVEEIAKIVGKTCGDFEYRIINEPDGHKLKLYPTPEADLADGLLLFYIRNATTIVGDASVIDIPEAHGFIKQYIGDKVINKERNTLDAPESAALKRKREALKLTLQKKTQTEKRPLSANYSYYADQV